MTRRVKPFAMFSEQWKPSLFAGIAFVLIGICYVAVAHSAPILSLPLSRNFTSQTVDWPASGCRPREVRFVAAEGSVSVVSVRLSFVGGRTQLLKRFSALNFRGTATDWFALDRSLRDGSALCIEKIEVTARAVGREPPAAHLQVEAR